MHKFFIVKMSWCYLGFATFQNKCLYCNCVLLKVADIQHRLTCIFHANISVKVRVRFKARLPNVQRTCYANEMYFVAFSVKS